MAEEEARPEEGDGTGSESHEIERLRVLLKEHGRYVLAGTAAALLVIVAVVLFRNQRLNKERRASSQLSAARSSQQLNELLRQHPSAAVAPAARLKLAKAYYDGGQYTLARVTYEQFLGKHGDDALASVAKLGKAHSLEAENQVEQAADAFRSFMASTPNHYLYPQAVLGHARCLEQLGRTDEARAVFEEFLAARPESRWAVEMEGQLVGLKKRMRNPADGLAAPASAGPTKPDLSRMISPGVQIQPEERAPAFGPPPSAVPASDSTIE